MSAFIEAYAVKTGAKQRIPADWLDHPVLGEQFRKTPSSRAKAAEDAKDSK